MKSTLDGAIKSYGTLLDIASHHFLFFSGAKISLLIFAGTNLTFLIVSSVGLAWLIETFLLLDLFCE